MNGTLSPMALLERAMGEARLLLAKRKHKRKVARPKGKPAKAPEPETSAGCRVPTGVTARPAPLISERDPGHAFVRIGASRKVVPIRKPAKAGKRWG